MLPISRYLPSVASALLLILVIPAVYPAPASAHSLDGEADVTVHMRRQGYDPVNVELKAGQTVAFENTDSVDLWPASNIHPTHEIYSAFDPKEPVPPGGIWMFTFTEAGTWHYHDHLYPAVTGTITVATSDKPTPAGDSSERAGLIARLTAFFKKLPARLLPRFFAPGDSPSNAAALEETYTYDDSISKNAAEVLYEQEDALYSYLKKFGPEQTMIHLHNLSPRLGSCHDTAHRVGRMSYQLYGEEVFQRCTAECHSGCYHGATEIFFKENGTSNLNESLKKICRSDLNPFFSHQCLHGIGHGLMAWASYDINSALNSCDLLDSGRDSCYSGVFMENIVGTLGEEEGHFTNYLNDDPHYPCNFVADEYKHACYFYQTSHMVTLFNGDFARIAATCSEAPQQFYVHCFQSMGRDIGGVHRRDPPGAIAQCQHAPAGSNRTDCLIGAVQDSLWDPDGQPDALQFCRLLELQGEKDACYDTIIARAPQVITGSQALKQFCNQVEPAYRQQCQEYLK